MWQHFRDTFEDVGIGVFMTVQMFRDYDKGLITVVLGAIYLAWKIYREYLRAMNEKTKKEILKQQLEGWIETKSKVEADLIKNSEAKVKRKKTK